MRPSITGARGCVLADPRNGIRPRRSVELSQTTLLSQAALTEHGHFDARDAKTDAYNQVLACLKGYAPPEPDTAKVYGQWS
jgi:hypothetical protein